ncbi:MAG TPA: YcxB family protein [Thermoanaerobaculia bacterium]|nr:YcxB family protein [Thermoanaerobaculia bacterium]
MEINFDVRLRDLVAFNLYHAPRHLVNQIVVLLAMAFFAPEVWRLDYPLGAKIFVILFIGVCAAVGLLAATGLFAAISYFPSKNRGVLGAHTVRISPDGVSETTAVNSSTWTWESVPKVAMTRRYVFIYVQQHVAHIIPKRAFESRAAATEFFRQAREAWSKYRERRPTPRSS